MSNDLTQQEALDIWGPINQQVAKEKAERGGFWKPAEGGLERGKIEKVYLRDDLNGGKSPTLDVRNKQGAVVVVQANNVVLRNKLAELAPVPGDEIEITNVFKPAGKRYWDMTVKVWRDGEEVTGANQSPPPF